MTDPNTMVSSQGYARSAVLGVLGGGQLGRMLALACGNLGVKVKALDPSPEACARAASTLVVGHFRDAASIQAFSHQVNVLTVEIEHVDVPALRTLEVDVQPNPDTLEMIQDKFVQKQFFASKGVPLGEFASFDDGPQLAEVSLRFGFPLMLKSRRLAYDGRGNFLCRSPNELEAGVTALGGFAQKLYAEKFQPFRKELAVVLARERGGAVVAYPVTETVHRNSICHITETPADVSPKVADRALQVARATIEALPGVVAGLFAVEMFVVGDEVLVNEVAPRPHNSGHYTMDACVTSQFENHARAVLDWPLGSASLTSPHVIMLNLLAEAEGEEGMRAVHEVMGRALAHPGCKVHWYGKCEDAGQVRVNRKLGHINILASSRAEARETLRGLDVAAFTSLSAAMPSPLVSIIMGSDSDLQTMSAAASLLEEQFGVPVEVTVVSAHRTPERLVEFAQAAHSRGVKVIIAGAGGAAHLPGMVAALTPLPVIGVPVVPASASGLAGVDALLSICQMPKGVPVATVAIGNSANAALLAVRILGVEDSRLVDRMAEYQARMRDEVLVKAERLEARGWRDYNVV